MIDSRIRERFTAAGVPLRIADSPLDFDRRILDGEPERIFMIDVRKRRGRTRNREFILLYCGEHAMVRTIDVCRQQQQLLLDVHEPGARVTSSRWDRKARKRVKEIIEVPPSQRRMLVGMDESHLFICQLAENASSVREAHQKLAPRVVHTARRHVKVKRQGEWFFVPVTRDEKLLEINMAVDSGWIKHGAPIAATGRPHLVEHLLELGETRYAMGKVRHPDHRVLELKTWHRVFQNTERVDQRPRGMTWVD